MLSGKMPIVWICEDWKFAVFVTVSCIFDPTLFAQHWLGVGVTVVALEVLRKFWIHSFRHAHLISWFARKFIIFLWIDQPMGSTRNVVRSKQKISGLRILKFSCGIFSHSCLWEIIIQKNITFAFLLKFSKYVII